MLALPRFFFVTFVLLIACESLANSIIVVDPYVRAIPPGMKVSAAFMTLKNNSSTDNRLIKAGSGSATNVELHEHQHKDGMMQMREVEAIDIPAKGSIALEPGGYHIMLIGLTHAIKSGNVIRINLEFSNGEKQTIEAEVKKINMTMDM